MHYSLHGTASVGIAVLANTVISILLSIAFAMALADR